MSDEDYFMPIEQGCDVLDGFSATYRDLIDNQIKLAWIYR
jgi:hypothetical protein